MVNSDTNDIFRTFIHTCVAGFVTFLAVISLVTSKRDKLPRFPLSEIQWKVSHVSSIKRYLTAEVPVMCFLFFPPPSEHTTLGDPSDFLETFLKMLLLSSGIPYSF